MPDASVETSADEEEERRDHQQKGRQDGGDHEQGRNEAERDHGARHQHRDQGDGHHLESLGVLHDGGVQRAEVRAIEEGAGREQDLFRQIGSQSRDRVPRGSQSEPSGHQPEAQAVGHGRRFGQRHLLPKDDLLHERSPATAIFLGPRNSRPAAFVELALPALEEVKAGFKRFFAKFIPICGRPIERSPSRRWQINRSA